MRRSGKPKQESQQIGFHHHLVKLRAVVQLVEVAQHRNDQLAVIGGLKDGGLLEERPQTGGIPVELTVTETKPDVAVTQVGIVHRFDRMNRVGRREMDIAFGKEIGFSVGGKKPLAADHIADLMAPLLMGRNGVSADALSSPT